jgi:hypothetical protein
MQHPIDRQPLSPAERLVLVAACALPLILLWGPPLYPIDEGRAAAAAVLGHASGSPLLDALHAGLARLAPEALWILRLPSALAHACLLLVLFAWARPSLGARGATIAVALAGTMPIAIAAARLAGPDAIVAAAIAGQCAIASRFPRASMPSAPLALTGFWGLGALAVLVGGSIGFVGAMSVLLWLAASGTRGDALRRLRPLVGCIVLACAAAGLLLAGGSPAPERGGAILLSLGPAWIPLVALLGAWPASALLSAGALRRLPTRAAAGDEPALACHALVSALAWPIAESLVRGSAALQALSLIVAPTALLGATAVEAWLRGTAGSMRVGMRLAGSATALSLGLLAAALAASHDLPELWVFAIPLAILPLAVVGGMALARSHRGLAGRGLAVAWIGVAAAWTLVFGIETRFVAASGADRLLMRMEELFAFDRPAILLVGFEDGAIAALHEGPVMVAEDLGPLPGLLEAGQAGIVLVRADLVGGFMERTPELTRLLEPIGTWTRWYRDPIRIFVVRSTP